LLFNLCLKSVFSAVEENLGQRGAFVGSSETEETTGFAVQASADDVVFISRSAWDMSMMPAKQEEFERWSGLEVNVGKCATASYRFGDNGHRCSQKIPLQLRGQFIPNLTLSQSLKYLT
jgi:hypothetical protein